MLITLIRRELLDNLMTFRFAAVLLITLLLVVVNTVVLIQDYEQRLESYNEAIKMHRQDLRNSKTYSTAYLFVDRAPNPLSIFNVGLDKRLGNLIGIYHGFMPTLWDAQMHGTDNPFIAFFSSIDIVFVFEVILSLMGLIFAYDENEGIAEETSEFSKAFGLYNDTYLDPVVLRSYIENVNFISEIPSEFEKDVPLAKKYYGFVERLTIRTIEKTWRIRKQALEDIFVRQAAVDRMLLKLSPVGIYDTATQAWTGTDLPGLRDFFEAARRYRKAVIDYLYAEDAFSSREWFVADKGAVDWSTLPAFTFQRSDVGTNAKRALPDLFLLLIANLVLFMGIVLIFTRSEV